MRKPIIALAIAFLATSPSLADVRLVRLPKGGQVPDIALDAKGVLHVTYGDGLPGDGYYIRSTDGGLNFSAPVKLNSHAKMVTTGMERGPKIALGQDGAIHVVYLGFYKKGGAAWYTRSTDGGKTFEPERQLNQPDYGLDNATIAADHKGNVVVLWTGGFPGTKEDKASPTASPIVLTRSSDNGKTFSKNELLKSDHPASSRACGCCRLEARMAGDQLYVAFRGGYKNYRDPYLLTGPKTENKFTCVCVSEDKWESGCPMQGIPFEVSGKGDVMVSWMSADRAYFAKKDGPGQFEKISAPRGNGAQSYPMSLKNAEGETLLFWREGNAIRHATYDGKGQAAGDQGQLKNLPGQHRPTGFVDGKGVFVIVY